MEKKKKQIKVKYYLEMDSTWIRIILDDRITLLFNHKFKRISANYLLYHLNISNLSCHLNKTGLLIKEEIIYGINSEDVRKSIIKVIRSYPKLINVKELIFRFNNTYHNYKKL